MPYHCQCSNISPQVFSVLDDIGPTVALIYKGQRADMAYSMDFAIFSSIYHRLTYCIKCIWILVVCPS